MGVFYFLFVVLFLSAILLNRSRGWGIFLVFLMGFICAFRGINVGTDTINYYMNNFRGEFSFGNVSSSSLISMEFGFQLISGFITQVGLSPRWCIYILAIITYTFLSMSAIRFNKILGTNVIVFVLLYFIMGYYGLAFNIARQMAATSILLYGYSYLIQDDNRKGLFFVFLFLASSLHISSLLYLVVYFFKYVNLNRINYKIIFTSSLVMLFIIQLFKGSLIGWIISKFSVLAFYSHYMEQTEEAAVSILGFVCKFFQLLLSLYVYHKLSGCTNRHFLNIYLASIFIDILFGALYGDIYRINIGFSVIQIIAYATYLSEFVYDCSLSPKLKFRITDETAFFILMIMVYGYGTLSSLAGGTYDVVPYYMTF